MKLSHPFFSEAFDFEKRLVHTLVIESPALLRSLTEELLQQCDGLKGEFLLTSSDGALDIGRSVECVTDLFRLESSENKRLCTAVQKEIAEIARYELSTELFSLYAHLQEVLAEAVYRSGLDLEYDEIDDINGILKLCDLRPALPKATLCEKLLLYMELCAKYLKKQLFIILHLHVLLSAEEIKSFCKNAVYRKLPILLLAGARAEFSEQESVHIVDDDLCEI